jgi:tol-pal system protein YbgF
MNTKMLRTSLLTMAFAFAWLLPAPVAAVDREHQQIMADIRMLQEQAQQLQALLNGLGDALKAVNTRLDEQTGLERKAFADGKVQMDSLSGDIRVVREKVDETNVRLATLTQEMEAIRTSMPQPGSFAAPTTTSSDASQPAGAAPAPLPPPAAGQTPQQLYSQAFADYAINQYSLAIQGFQAFLNYFPKNDQADNAQFYIGESYSNDGKFAEAVTAYTRVITNYPGTDSVPNAYYKRGRALEELKRFDEAKLSYEAVIKESPDSDGARLAKLRLDGLTKSTGR